MANLDAARKAMNSLIGSGFKLWFYFNSNQDGYSFDLSQKACEEWGIKKDSYYKAVKELIDKNYLIPLSEGSNVFYFYENGDGEKPKSFSEIPTSKSEEPKSVSEIQNKPSENPKRNNTNNTDNTINNTEDIISLVEKTNNEGLRDYSYLLENNIILCDGSFTTAEGESTWLDQVERGFWNYGREEKIQAVMKHVRLNRKEAEYAVDYIMN